MDELDSAALKALLEAYMAETGFKASEIALAQHVHEGITYTYFDAAPAKVSMPPGVLEALEEARLDSDDGSPHNVD